MNENIQSNLLRLRILNDKTQEKIAEDAGISLLTYRNIESGKSMPNIDTLTKLANVFNVRIEDFFKECNKIEAVRFRAVNEKNIKKREEIIYIVSSWLENFNNLVNKLNENDNYRYKLEDIEGSTLDPKEMANKVRAKFDIKNEPIRDICGLLEFRAGIKLYAREFNSDNFFGLSLKDSNNNRVVVVNTWDRISVERRIFSVAHELGHILLHLNSFNSDLTFEDPQEEKEADTFASYLLMPENEFLQEWQKADNCDFVDRVIKVKQIFRVSYKVVLYRLNELIKLQKPNYNIWPIFYREYSKKYNTKLSKKDEMYSLNVNSKELQALSNNIYFGRGIASLVKKAYMQKLLSIEKCAEILDKTKDEMKYLINTWDLEYNIPFN